MRERQRSRQEERRGGDRVEVRKGLNADDGSAFNVTGDNGDSDRGGLDLKKGNCGCDSTPAAPMAWTLAGLGGLILTLVRPRVGLPLLAWGVLSFVLLLLYSPLGRSPVL